VFASWFKSESPRPLSGHFFCKKVTMVPRLENDKITPTDLNSSLGIAAEKVLPVLV